MLFNTIKVHGYFTEYDLVGRFELLRFGAERPWCRARHLQERDAGEDEINAASKRPRVLLDIAITFFTEEGNILARSAVGEASPCGTGLWGK